MRRTSLLVAAFVLVCVPVALAKPTPYSSAQFYTPEAMNACSSPQYSAQGPW